MRGRIFVREGMAEVEMVRVVVEEGSASASAVGARRGRKRGMRMRIVECGRERGSMLLPPRIPDSKREKTGVEIGSKRERTPNRLFIHPTAEKLRVIPFQPLHIPPQTPTYSHHYDTLRAGLTSLSKIRYFVG